MNLGELDEDRRMNGKMKMMRQQLLSVLLKKINQENDEELRRRRFWIKQTNVNRPPRNKKIREKSAVEKDEKSSHERPEKRKEKEERETRNGDS